MAILLSVTSVVGPFSRLDVFFSSPGDLNKKDRTIDADNRQQARHTCITSVAGLPAEVSQDDKKHTKQPREHTTRAHEPSLPA